ncbi:DUF362 domain-containing protein [Blautia wexlerae]|nr:DUF362 domain-containing protein [Blautia wexlerae]
MMKKKSICRWKQGLDFLGGVETLIPKDAKILLKPNLLKKAEVEKAVITHPVVVGVFAGILRESGYENIVLADSCGHGTTQAVIRGTGMDTYLEKYHIPAVDYSEGVKTAYPQGSPGKGIYPAKRTVGAGLCDFPEQDENTCIRTYHRCG